MFWDLNELRRGSRVVLTDSEGNKYIYRVYDRFILGPNDTSATKPVAGMNVISLQTCTLPNYTDRLIVRAELVRTAQGQAPQAQAVVERCAVGRHVRLRMRIEVGSRKRAHRSARYDFARPQRIHERDAGRSRGQTVGVEARLFEDRPPRELRVVELVQQLDARPAALTALITIPSVWFHS